MAIQSFANKTTQHFFETGRRKRGGGWSSVGKIVKRKLDMLHYAAQLSDLKSPPGNRLELLRGKLSGKYSVRVNDQWRIVFDWTPLGPTNVEVTDYH